MIVVGKTTGDSPLAIIIDKPDVVVSDNKEIKVFKGQDTWVLRPAPFGMFPDQDVSDALQLYSAILCDIICGVPS